jgi:hypothetical protein
MNDVMTTLRYYGEQLLDIINMLLLLLMFAVISSIMLVIFVFWVVFMLPFIIGNIILDPTRKR